MRHPKARAFKREMSVTNTIYTYTIHYTLYYTLYTNAIQRI